MPEADIDRLYDYSPEFLADILKSVKTIAMVGASGDKTKFSYGVLRVLHETGYEILPVNPSPKLTEIRGIPVYRSLEEIDRPVDMVEVFGVIASSTSASSNHQTIRLFPVLLHQFSQLASQPTASDSRHSSKASSLDSFESADHT